MFLLSITTSSVVNNFRNESNVSHEIKIDNFFHTIVTDGFYSHSNKIANGYEITESIFDEKNLNLINVNYDNIEKVISVNRRMSSGRPLFYYSEDNQFYCSTSIRFLKISGITLEENYRILPEFFIYRYVFPPNTLYKNIFQVPVGTILNVSCLGATLRLNLEDHLFNSQTTKKMKNEKSLDNSADVFNSLENSIELLQKQRRNVDILLSGGLDSSILFRYAQDLLGVNKSYSTIYPFEKNSENKEKMYALSAAKAFNSSHFLFETNTNDYLYGIIDSIHEAEMPIHHMQSALLHLLFKSAMHNNIIISGEGADGIFGNDFHRLIFQWNKNLQLNSILSQNLFYGALSTLTDFTGKGQKYTRILEFGKNLHLNFDDENNVFYRLESYGDMEWVKNYFNVKHTDIFESRYKILDSFRNRSFYELITIMELLGGGAITQQIWSKIGESNKKMIYYPFYNENAYDSAMNIPWEIKVKNPKQILREIAFKLKIPENLVTRPKSSFGIHFSKWSGINGILEPLKAMAYKYFDKGFIEKTQINNPKLSMIYWNILNYSIWKRMFIENESLDNIKSELAKQIQN